MDIALLGIILIPIAISLFCKFALKFDICWKEFLVQAVVGLLCLSFIWFLGKLGAGSDTEILNGAVTGKEQVRVSCEHSYSCNCRTVTSGSGNNQVTQTVCDTCYEHSYDWDWDVYSTIGTFTIDRIDSQGNKEPKRWSIVNTGDPVSRTHSYQNWVKASVDSLYHQDKDAVDKYKDLIIPYNLKIYDYYKIDRIYTIHTKLNNVKLWNEELSKTLSVAGPKKQINMVVVMVEGADKDYAYALRRSWEGFKKNEAVLIIGLNKGNIAWAQSMSWSKNSIFDIHMRDLLENYVGQNINEVNPAQIMTDVGNIINRDFQRRSMKEFEYLRGEIPPPTWLLWFSVIFAIVLGIGTSVMFNKIDAFSNNSYKYRNSFTNRHFR